MWLLSSMVPLSNLWCWFFSQVSCWKLCKFKQTYFSVLVSGLSQWDFCLRAAFILKGISTVLFFFSTSWKNRIWCIAVPLHLHVFLRLLWSVVGLFIVRVNISWLGCLVRRAAASNRHSLNAWISERKQQERWQVNPELSCLQLKSQTDRSRVRLSKI